MEIKQQKGRHGKQQRRSHDEEKIWRKKVTITATAKDGSKVKAAYKITSMKGVVKKVAISGKKTVKAGRTLKLKAKVTATKKANLLEPGIPNYNVLNQSYVIMIMTFDLFGYKKYVYTFKNKCKEVAECSLGDGTTKIYLNTKGKNARRIHDRVCKVKLSEEVGVKYMQAWEEKYYEREEGREEGRIEGREEGRIKTLVTLVCKKLAKGMEAADIADMLEEEESVIQNICNIAKRYAPDYHIENIMEELFLASNDDQKSFSDNQRD